MLSGHWKTTCNTNYLGSHDLATQDGGFGKLTLTISDIKQEEVHDPKSNKKTLEIVIHFVEKYKPMILNSTNKKMIGKVTGSDFMETWINKRITIQVERVQAFGDTHNALRISSIPPKAELLPQCECCGKATQPNIYNSTKKSYGYGLCSVECKEQFIKEGKIIINE